SVADAGLVFIVAAATLLVGAGLLVRVRVEGRVEIDAVEQGSAVTMLSTGLRAIWRAADTRLIMGLVIAQTFVRGCLNVLIVVAAFQVLDEGAGAVGDMRARTGVGGGG